MRFDWDPVKHEKNLRAHGVRFEDVIRAFDDPLSLDREDDRFRYGELRHYKIAMVGSATYSIVYTMRQNDELCWLISARHAEPQEKRWYHE